MANAVLWKSNLAGPEAITCASCAHTYSKGISACPSCGATATKTAGDELLDRARARAKDPSARVVDLRALDQAIRENPGLYERHAREVKAKDTNARATVSAKSQPAPARVTAGQAFIEAAVAALVSKTNASRRDAYDAVMKTPEGRAAYLNHLNDLGTVDCS